MRTCFLKSRIGADHIFYFVTGDLLKSEAYALVNTVNCEGFMGKGIAYQFKLRFPENNKSYVKACRSGELRPGILHHYVEDGKFIVNFPTKDKWRNNSKIEYIEDGLNALIQLAKEEHLQSIAIPPLGSGNGGLSWNDVKPIIERKLSDISEFTDIYIYEPSKYYSTQPISEPKLNVSGIILMDIKLGLKKFTSFRLQKTAYFANLFTGSKYFSFSKQQYGPYDHSIDIIAKNIQEFQKFYNVETVKAREILYGKIASSDTDAKLSLFAPSIQKACCFVNSIARNHDLECLSTICFIIEACGSASEDEIIQNFKNWSARKASIFSVEEIKQGLKKLQNNDIIMLGLDGYRINICDQIA